MLIIVAFFFLCRAPYSVLGLAYAMAQTRMSVGVDTVAMWLFWSSCAINPCIYAVRNPVLAEALHLRDGRHQVKQHSATSHQIQGAPPRTLAPAAAAAAAAESGAVNSSEIAVSLCRRTEHRSDSIPSVLLFSVARKGSSQSTTTTSTNV